MGTLLGRLWVEEEGQTLVEYALIIALVAIAVIAALTVLGGKVRDKYNEMGNQL